MAYGEFVRKFLVDLVGKQVFLDLVDTVMIGRFIDWDDMTYLIEDSDSGKTVLINRRDVRGLIEADDDLLLETDTAAK